MRADASVRGEPEAIKIWFEEIYPWDTLLQSFVRWITRRSSDILEYLAQNASPQDAKTKNIVPIQPPDASTEKVEVIVYLVGLIVEHC